MVGVPTLANLTPALIEQAERLADEGSWVQGSGRQEGATRTGIAAAKGGSR